MYLKYVYPMLPGFLNASLEGLYKIVNMVLKWKDHYKIAKSNSYNIHLKEEDLKQMKKQKKSFKTLAENRSMLK